MHDTAVWSSDTAGLYSARLRCPWGGVRYVVVEAVPGGGWDWVAWASDVPDEARHGQTAELVAAMAAARLNAGLLAWTPRFDFRHEGQELLQDR